MVRTARQAGGPPVRSVPSDRAAQPGRLIAVTGP
jgi:hypothetical protein